MSFRATSGISVTRAYPMDKVAGESTDHPHHRSLWFAHSSVNGFDYWNNEFSYESMGLITSITRPTGWLANRRNVSLSFANNAVRFFSFGA